MSKVWFITGSSRGLGRSLAEAVLAHGDLLVATARNPEQLGDLVSRYGEQIRAVALDVTNPEQARTAVATAIDAFGPTWRLSKTPPKKTGAPRSKRTCGG